jgi:hypothetical protein
VNYVHSLLIILSIPATIVIPPFLAEKQMTTQTLVFRVQTNAVVCLYLHRPESENTNIFYALYIPWLDPMRGPRVWVAEYRALFGLFIWKVSSSSHELVCWIELLFTGRCNYVLCWVVSGFRVIADSNFAYSFEVLTKQLIFYRSTKYTEIIRHLCRKQISSINCLSPSSIFLLKRYDTYLFRVHGMRMKIYVM